MFDLKVGFSCNNNCIHCVVGSKRGTQDLSFKDICQVIDTVPVNEIIQLTGGEITIRKDFTDIVQYCGEHGHKVVIQTNGTGLTVEKLEQIKPYIDEVLIAIHSSRPRIHNLIVRARQKDNMFQRTINGLQALIETQVPFCTQTVISKVNMASLHETFQYIQDLSPGTYMHLTYPHPLGEAWENRELVLPAYKELTQFIQPCFRDFGPFLIIEAIPPCYIFPYYQNVNCNLDADIKKGLCARAGFDPACKENNFFENYRTADYNLNDKDSKRKGPKCLDCVYNEECIGVWREYVDVYKIHFDLFPVTLTEKTELNFPVPIQVIDLSLQQTFTELQDWLNAKIENTPIIFYISDSSHQYRAKLALAKALAEIAEDYSFPISFWAIPRCYLTETAKVIDNPALDYGKLPGKCDHCQFSSACLGFNTQNPFLENIEGWK